MYGKQRGFTLVEIAIVLVIIGLLLGGILKGQELITSARVRNLADSNSGIQAAYYGFIDRYRQIPGDMLLVDAQNAISADVTCGATAATRNGRIDPGNWNEASAVWTQLSYAEFISNLYTACAGAAGPYEAPDNAPVNPFQNYYLLSYSNGYLPPPGGGGGASPNRLNLSLGNGLPVKVVRELDVKIDDGLPETGIVRAPVNGGPFTPVTDDSGNCLRAPVGGGGGGQVWDVDTNDHDCSAVYLY